MIELFTKWFQAAEEAVGRLGAWIRGATPRQKKWLRIGAFVTGASAIAGGHLWAAAAGGIVLNIMFLNMIKDNAKATQFMKDWGWGIDVVLTAGALLFSGGTFTGTMLNMTLTAYFTIFREVMFPPTEGKAKGDDKGFFARLWAKFKGEPAAAAEAAKEPILEAEVVDGSTH